MMPLLRKSHLKVWLGLMLLALALTPPASAQTFTVTSDIPVPPTGTIGTTCVAFDVPASVTITDVDVLLYVTHTFDADLSFTLTSPAGTTVALATNRGGAGDNYGLSAVSPTIFDDAAGTAISAGAPPFAGSFRPESPLSAFNTQSTLGQWHLVLDDNAGGDSGALHFLGLRINGNTTATPVTFSTGPNACPVAGHQHTTHGHTSGVLHHGEHGHSVGFQDPPHPFGHKPGLTADPGQGRIFVAGVNQDGTFNGNPATLQVPGMNVRAATRGSVLQLFGPAVELALTDGGSAPVMGDSRLLKAPVDGNRLYRTLNLPEVFVGGVRAEVLYSGLAPGLTGVWQIDVRIPEAAPQGYEVPVLIQYEGAPLPRKMAVAVQ